MRQTVKEMNKVAKEKKDVYVQIDVPGEYTLSEKVDGLVGVTIKDNGDGRETKVTIAAPLTPDVIESTFIALSNAVTTALVRNTPLDAKDVYKFLMSAVRKGVADGAIDLLAEVNPQAAKGAKELQAMIELIAALK